MRIVYRRHLIRRLKERKIPSDYPKKIIKNAEQEYFDSITKHRIAIKELRYTERLRNMVIAYDIIQDNTEIITIYPIKHSEVRNKIQSGRWKVYEKN